jgi:hypothetical protein
MWILTIFLIATSGQVTRQQVKGFKSREACEARADVLVPSLKKKNVWKVIWACEDSANFLK